MEIKDKLSEKGALITKQIPNKKLTDNISILLEIEKLKASGLYDKE